MMRQKTNPTVSEIMALFAKADEARAFLHAFETWLTNLPKLPALPEIQLGVFEDHRSYRQLTSHLSSIPKTEMVLEFLYSNPGEAFRVSQILRWMRDQGVTFESERPAASISSILSRHAKQGKVEQLRRGWWMAKDDPSAAYGRQMMRGRSHTPKELDAEEEEDG